MERGEPASGVKAPEAELEHRPAGYGAPSADEDEFVIEDTPEAEEDIEIGEAAASEDELELEEGEAGAERSEGEASGDEAERNRRRRRRRRRRGGERPPGEGISADAPQPTDDGLAVVAEIGGDFSTPAPSARGDEEGVDENGRPNGARRRRSRRGRRGERDRFAPPSLEGEAEASAEVAAEAEADESDAAAELAEPDVWAEPAESDAAAEAPVMTEPAPGARGGRDVPLDGDRAGLIRRRVDIAHYRRGHGARRRARDGGAERRRGRSAASLRGGSAPSRRSVAFDGPRTRRAQRRRNRASG